MGLENIETVTNSATCRSLDIQELANVSAQSFGASSSSSSSSISIKKENEQSDLLNDVRIHFFNAKYFVKTNLLLMQASTNCSSNSKGNNIVSIWQHFQRICILTFFSYSVIMSAMIKRYVLLLF